jgi:hypothetical protein
MVSSWRICNDLADRPRHMVHVMSVKASILRVIAQAGKWVIELELRSLCGTRSNKLSQLLLVSDSVHRDHLEYQCHLLNYIELAEHEADEAHTVVDRPIILAG